MKNFNDYISQGNKLVSELHATRERTSQTLAEYSFASKKMKMVLGINKPVVETEQIPVKKEFKELTFDEKLSRLTERCKRDAEEFELLSNANEKFAQQVASLERMSTKEKFNVQKWWNLNKQNYTMVKPGIMKKVR